MIRVVKLVNIHEFEDLSNIFASNLFKYLAKGKTNLRSKTSFQLVREDIMAEIVLMFVLLTVRRVGIQTDFVPVWKDGWAMIVLMAGVQ